MVEKKIRIDFYQYRVRKGRVDILLERDSTNDSFFVPFHYVLADESIHPKDLWSGNMEDDGDLVILRCSINDCHVNRKNKEWIPLMDVPELRIGKGDPKKVVQYCLALFLEQNPSVEEILLEKVKKHLEEHLIARAKEDYINKLTRVLNGEPIIYLDAMVTPPDSKLLEEEIKTMAHFQLYKMNRLDASYRSLKYSYEPIPWEEFGAKISSIGITSISDTLEDWPK